MRFNSGQLWAMPGDIAQKDKENPSFGRYRPASPGIAQSPALIDFHYIFGRSRPVLPAVKTQGYCSTGAAKIINRPDILYILQYILT